MLTETSEVCARGALPQKQAPVVELVGPAGSGKTTLLHLLSSPGGPMVSGILPQFRRPSDLLFMVGHGMLLTPTLLRLSMLHRKWLSPHEVRCMITLSGWHRLCRRHAASRHRPLLLDQAAVFMMVELYEFGPEILRSRTAGKWWKRVYQRWAPTLDLIVWLDASNTVLRERIRSRARWHMVKDKSENEMFEFLARYRRGYERVISTLTANSCGPKVLRIDTEHATVDEAAGRVLLELGL